MTEPEKEKTTVATQTSTPTKAEAEFVPTEPVATDTTLTIEQAQAALDEARSRFFAGTITAEEFEAAKANVVSARSARRRG